MFIVTCVAIFYAVTEVHPVPLRILLKVLLQLYEAKRTVMYSNKILDGTSRMSHIIEKVRRTYNNMLLYFF